MMMMRLLNKIANWSSRIFDVIFWINCSWIYGRRNVTRVESSLLRNSASQAACKLRSGAIRSYDLVEACIDRTCEVDEVIHAVVDRFFADALLQAKQVDDDLARLRSQDQAAVDALFAAKPFYGVPITIKSSFAVRGASLDVGLLSREHERATYDANEVRRLRDAGFIVLCTTAVPELVAWLETSSLLRKRTLNPYNTLRGVGGSSGGEAALIASGGVSVGFGSDSGGSIRFPTAFCGIFGHKPTSDDSTDYSLAVPADGDAVSQSDDRNRPTHYPPAFSKRQMRMLAFGPLCRYAEDLWPLLLTSLSDSDRRRIAANAKRSPAEVNWKRTKFLLIPSLCTTAVDGPTATDYFLNSPDRLVDEALDRVVQFIRKDLKSDVEPFRFVGDEFSSLRLVDLIDVFSAHSSLPDCVDEVSSVPQSEWRTDDGRSWIEHASMFALHSNGDQKLRVSPVRELLKILTFGVASPQRITLPILLSAFVEQEFTNTPHEQLAKILRLGASFQRAFERLFTSYKQAGYEHVVILCPAYPHVAPYHCKPVICSPYNAFYSAIFNVLGLPCTTAPILKDDASRTNLPAGVQIVSDKFDDFTCIAFAQLLEQVFGGWHEPASA